MTKLGLVNAKKEDTDKIVIEMTEEEEELENGKEAEGKDPPLVTPLEAAALLALVEKEWAAWRGLSWPAAAPAGVDWPALRRHSAGLGTAAGLLATFLFLTTKQWSDTEGSLALHCAGFVFLAGISYAGCRRRSYFSAMFSASVSLASCIQLCSKFVTLAGLANMLGAMEDGHTAGAGLIGLRLPVAALISAAVLCEAVTVVAIVVVGLARLADRAAEAAEETQRESAVAAEATRRTAQLEFEKRFAAGLISVQALMDHNLANCGLV